MKTVQIKVPLKLSLENQRNGPIGTSRLAFIGKYTRFEDLVHSYDGYDDIE